MAMVDSTVADCANDNPCLSKRDRRAFLRASMKIKNGFSYLGKSSKFKTFFQKRKLNTILENLNTWVAYFQSIRNTEPAGRLHLSFLTRITEQFVRRHTSDFPPIRALYLNARGAKDDPNDEDNKIFSFSENISDFKELAILYARFNQLQRLPTSIGELEKLVELGVEGNQLESIPPSLCYLKSLRELGLDQNKLRALPEGLSRLPQLTILSVDDQNCKGAGPRSLWRLAPA